MFSPKSPDQRLRILAVVLPHVEKDRWRNMEMPGEDRTLDPMFAKHVWQGNLVDFAARLATLSH